MSDIDQCLGPPCQHFPSWVKTAQDARDYLAVKAISAGVLPGLSAARTAGDPRPLSARYDRERRAWVWPDGAIIREDDLSEADKRAVELWLCYPERGPIDERLMRYARRYEGNA